MKAADQILTGLTESHLVEFGGAKVHKDVLLPLKAITEALKKEGFQLGLASSFRSFPAQLNIWNKKARGEKVLLDAYSKPLEYANLSPKEIIHAILRWSALPGLSRHHWGTDFDVYDKNTLPDGYQIQLIPSEFEQGGYFSKMHEWLDKNMARFGFFRPYQKDLGGISPERWHISYSPLAKPLMESHSVELETIAIKNSSLVLKTEVLSELESLFERYFLNISEIV